MNESKTLVGCVVLVALALLACNQAKSDAAGAASATPAAAAAPLPPAPVAQPTPTPAPTVSAKPATPKVTMANYEALKTGMTYAEAKAILGSAGEELSSSQFGNIKTSMYKWEGEGFANLTLMFQNDKLQNKSQFGLK